MAEFNKDFFERGMDFINLVHQSDADTDFDTDWIKLRDYDRVAIVIKKLGSEDVDTLGFQFLQGTDASGGSAKALNVSRIAYKQGTMTSQGTWTRNTLATPDDIIGVGSAAPTGGTLVNATDANTSAIILVVDIMTTDLDIDGGFDWIAVRVEGDETNNATLVSIDAILMGSRFPQAVPLSAIS